MGDIEVGAEAEITHLADRLAAGRIIVRADRAQVQSVGDALTQQILVWVKGYSAVRSQEVAVGLQPANGYVHTLRVKDLSLRSVYSLVDAGNDSILHQNFRFQFGAVQDGEQCSVFDQILVHHILLVNLKSILPCIDPTILSDRCCLSYDIVSSDQNAG